ncbi:MAG: ROK family protein [Sphingomonas sp.]|nr:ROK family protein [Sphingomonas sp.]
MALPRRLGGIELGGTKAIAILSEDGRIIESRTIPTGAPEPTLAALNGQLAEWHAQVPLAALGIAAFGPLQLDHAKPDFGTMLATPKPGWSGAKVAALIVGDLDCPWLIDTDVNGAALAEYRSGAGQGYGSICYITIGTGLGGGLLIDGKPVHGVMHPEIGHLRLRRAPGDMFAGVCPFHADCLEGLVSGPALAARFGCDAAMVPDWDAGWAYVASDIAALCGAILLTTSAQRILFGGSVMVRRTFLLPLVHTLVVQALGSYLPFLTQQTARDMIRIAGLGSEAGTLGAIALASAALE